MSEHDGAGEGAHRRSDAPPEPAAGRSAGFSTRAIRAATRAPIVEQRPTSVPIYQTATFSAELAAELGAVATDRQPGYAYSRLDNPTVSALAAAVAELEGAPAGFALASGMAAIHATLLSLLGAGDRIVAAQAIYGTTGSLLRTVFGKLGIDVAFVDATDLAAVEAALAARPTQVLYVETISNPTIVVVDLAALAELAHRHGATLVVDNTFASPYLCRPLSVGSDLVIHSATKYLSGHSDVLGGVVVGSRERVRAVRAVQVDTGATLAPLAAFLILRGLPTLAIRMERHSATALALARWLEGRPGVERVFYPALASHPQATIARRELSLGGGMLAVELAGGRVAGEAFIDALTVPERTASLGSVHTIVAHPPSTTHRQFDEAALAAAGIAPGLLRVSVGLEDLPDLEADFASALAVAADAADADAADAANADAADAAMAASPATSSGPATAATTPGAAAAPAALGRAR
ncbi:MAG TPA: aminotransferase class I/II-fold pyridoxal phosphate-dependent enzyme [Candidatus Limnocylindrales bacterium]